MPAAKPTIVVVDTNCYIRLLFSPLRPVLGETFAGHMLMTLMELAEECGPGTEVAERHPWLLDVAVQQELQASCLKVRDPKKSQIVAGIKYFRREGNSLLRRHCLANRLDKVRELSSADCRALATAQVLGARLATDEWPLALVAGEISDVPAVLTSIAVIHMMELDGKISREQRVAVVSSWVKHGEKLPGAWHMQYRHLFQEEPPDGQH